MKTFSVKTDKEKAGGGKITIGNFLKIIDDETGEQVFPRRFKLEIETDDVVIITMEFPVSEVDVDGVVLREHNRKEAA
jgi:hypothetical protein